MPRIRSIKPEFFSDPDLGRLPLEGRYLYIGMWPFADDEGRIPADPRLLKSQVFPYDDKVTVTKVRKLVGELAATGKVYPYTVAGVDYLLLTRFKKHQRIDRAQSAKYPGPLEEDSSNGSGTLVPDTKGGDTTRPDTTGGDPSPLTPASGGAEKVNPRAAGTNPRAVARRKRDDELAARRAEIEACAVCDDNGIVFDEATDAATRCTHPGVEVAS